MWIFYLIVLIIFIIVVWKITKYIKTKNYPKEDVFYYKVTTISGNQSIIHNSGIKPSEIKEKSIFFSILKNEYNNGEVQNISDPYKIEIGYHPKNLFNAKIISIKEEKLLYKIEVEPPKLNPFIKLKQD